MHQHLIAKEVWEKLKETFPKASLSSVYRNLDEMVERDEINKRKSPNGEWIYEANIGDHAHLIDTKTGKILDFDIADLGKLNIPDNFQVKKMNIHIYGEFC